MAQKKSSKVEYVATGADPETRGGGGGVTEEENCIYIIVFDCPW